MPKSRATTVAASYLNFYICNGAVIVPVSARTPTPTRSPLIAGAYPGREVVPVPGAVLAYGGGGPHCITQQVPVRDAYPELLTALEPPDSPARTRPPERAPLRVGLVQERWHPTPDEHEEALARGIRMAAGEGARIVCLQELTLSPYFAITPDGPAAAGARPRTLETGGRSRSRARMARETGAYVHASLYERADGPDGLGYNTAIVVSPGGRAGHAHAQAPHPGHRRLLRGPLLPPRAGRRAIRSRWSELRADGATARSAPRPAGTSGSPSWRGRTRSRARRC